MADSTLTNLLKKYDRPGPRYTSYPTVPVWSTEFGGTDYLRCVDRIAGSTEPIAAYVHIPFCEHRCDFCGCNVVITRRDDVVEEYLSHLFSEIDAIAKRLGENRRVVQLHWGGGTPSHLTIGQMTRLWEHLTAVFDIEQSGEIAIEVDPRVTTREQLAHLRSLGFNRLSLGVQDLNPDVQAAITRNQTLEQTEATYECARALGYKGINMDLIYGLPRQQVSSFDATLNQVARWQPDRLAVYSYAHVPWIRPHQKLMPTDEIPTGPEKFALFERAVTRLQDAGYVPIGFDHFALPDDELARGLNDGRLHRNFMGYTVASTPHMIGFGVSAISEVGGCFAQSEPKLSRYYEGVSREGCAIHRGWELSTDDEIRQFAILRLMCRMSLNYAELQSRFGVDFSRYFAADLPRLDEFIADGLLKLGEDALAITPLGRNFIRNICMVFDAYLENSGSKAQEGRPVFSRTV